MAGRGWNARSYDLGRMSFADLVKAYATYPAIMTYAALAVVTAAGAAITAVSALPLLTIPAVMAAYPVAWYLIHRFILHSRFLYRSPATAAVWKRIHFGHHQDPNRLEVLFGALWTTLPTVALVTMPLGAAIAGVSGALAAFSTGLVVTCVYEFVHCIQHLNFKPRNRLLKRMKELHLLHHYHHEEGNYGITNFTVDRIAGSFYGKARERERSPHVFNLGYDRETAKRYPWVERLTGAPPRDRPPRPKEVRRESSSTSSPAP